MLKYERGQHSRSGCCLTPAVKAMTDWSHRSTVCSETRSGLEELKRRQIAMSGQGPRDDALSKPPLLRPTGSILDRSCDRVVEPGQGLCPICWSHRKPRWW